jgi:hypothetical protein
MIVMAHSPGECAGSDKKVQMTCVDRHDSKGYPGPLFERTNERHHIFIMICLLIRLLTCSDGLDNRLCAELRTPHCLRAVL